MNTLKNQKYEDYIKSPEWKAKASQRMKIDQFRCQMCGCIGTARNPLNVHHMTYHNVYKENVDRDIVTLCRACHYGVHVMMSRITNSATGQRGWKDTLPYSVHVFSTDEKTNELIIGDEK